MSNFKVRLASAFLLSVAASAGLTVSSAAARASDGCITEPKTDTAPQGKHWHYRIERGSGRHCWYLRGANEASARTPAAEQVAARPAPSAPASAPPRSLADAHAELAPKAASEDTSAASAPSVWPDPPAAAAAAAPAPAAPGPAASAPAAPPDSQLASRWPQPSGAPSTVSAAPQAPQAPLTVADAQADDSAAATPVAASPSQASAPPAREVGSLQKLALVAFGALALAGISGSLVFRLAGTRWRRRHQERWPQQQPAAPSFADEARGAPWVAPELSPTVPHEHVEYEDDPDAEHVETVADRVEFGKNDDSFEKIEDFLARLTRQLQDEIEPRATELENPRSQ